MGLAVAIIIDSSIVRMLFVPAAMKLMGDQNWWAPAPLRRFHDRFGLSEPGHLPVIDISTEADRADSELLEPEESLV